jgi:L,D-transpeptidase ErfK/SrfK
MNRLALVICLAFAFARGATAETHLISTTIQEDVVGELHYVEPLLSDTLLDIARRYGLGYQQIVSANPNVSRWVPESEARVLLPQRYVLPASPRQGIVLNLAELRLYYYPEVENPGPRRPVMTFPVSIGRMDWRTPLGTTTVVKKEVDPAWHPTASIRKEHAESGDELPDFIPGGDPTNPLGRFALRLGLPAYLIHGTDERKASGIGMRVTHGCVRMYPEDIERLFHYVEVGTAVQIIDQPLKVGLRSGEIYLEVHHSFDEDDLDNATPEPVTFAEALEKVREAAGPGATIDEQAIARTVNVANGVSVPVAVTAGLLPPAKQPPAVIPSTRKPVKGRKP